MKDVNSLTFIEHLSELRKRLFFIIIVVLVLAGISYVYIQPIVENIITIAGNNIDFIYISPSELFLVYIKISLVAGIVVSSPIIFYEIWRFLKPGLEKKERRYMLASLLGGTFFFILGVIFCYTVVLPMVLKFFLSLTMEGIQPMISIGNYISFIATTLLSFGIVFEMPILVLILSKFGLITSEFLKNNRKYIILIIFIVAAILTPPDVISQLLLAAPMLILYELSIFIAKISEKSKNKVIVERS